MNTAIAHFGGPLWVILASTPVGSLPNEYSTTAIWHAESCRLVASEGEFEMIRKQTVEMVSTGLIARRLLNVREAAHYLGLEVDTVYKKSRLREVPCVKGLLTDRPDVPRPVKAAFRSTTCRQFPPSSSQRLAKPKGSSE